jgi:hypothetical protein
MNILHISMAPTADPLRRFRARGKEREKFFL